ncbi:c-type cytochrome [Azomonas macrocytogenes]|uniref:Mono/diheme cytochrome c family protein n=1 Tax=Azomonas macrocytogenes TaxID=69962 RepID=A0A839T3J7_AZOMA|nr:c-type cytochrome [Azomonas macrocytogenes]MBB3102313.1 mono/diheme cytochrome c family protein [Azomonas macrocytogenes]
MKSLVQAIGLLPALLPLSIAAQERPDFELIQQGEYLARIADCAACHTAPDGEPFAGRQSLPMPLGRIYSTNITPDHETGIGNYRLQDFERALRQGIAKDGYTLYPVMPYPSFMRLSDRDIQALYSYFRYSVQPAKQWNKTAELPWPLSMRWTVGLWRRLFVLNPEEISFNAARYPDPDTVRGAYLVQGIGHCGTCHTPKAFTQQETVQDDTSPRYLSGGRSTNGRVAPSLRSDSPGGLSQWTVEEIAQALKTGRNPRNPVATPVDETRVHRGWDLSNEDLHSIAVYLKTLSRVPEK